MYLKILLNYILGYVNIKVEGFFIERFINICISKKILLWNIKRKKSTIMYANIGINDYKKYADYCKKIILFYDSDNTYIPKNRKKVNLEFKDIQDINDVLNVSKRKKDILRKNNFDIFMYFILATFIFVLSLLLINKNKLYNDSVKQNELLSKNVSDLQEKNKNYTNYLFLGDSITDFYDLI